MENWYTFTRIRVIGIVPQAGGVYAIRSSRTGKMVYVGESDNLERQLLEHIDERSDETPCITRNSGDTFAWEVIASPKERALRQMGLVRDHRPICNG